MNVINAVWVRQGLSNLRHSLSPQLLDLLVGKLLKSTPLADFPALNYPTLKLSYVHQGTAFINGFNVFVANRSGCYFGEFINDIGPGQG